MPLHIALIQPQIPPNTGNIARLCAATDTSLHLIEPLGFSINGAEVRRAGLDYWDDVDLWIHPDWFAFRDAMDRSRCLYFSAKAQQSYWNASYRSNSCLVFGSETEGMPQRILEKHPEQCFRIPMSGPVRSLNLSTAVGIVLYEALRQTRKATAADERRFLPKDTAAPEDTRSTPASNPLTMSQEFDQR